MAFPVDVLLAESCGRLASSISHAIVCASLHASPRSLHDAVAAHLVVYCARSKNDRQLGCVRASCTHSYCSPITLELSAIHRQMMTAGCIFFSCFAWPPGRMPPDEDELATAPMPLAPGVPTLGRRPACPVRGSCFSSPSDRVMCSLDMTRCVSLAVCVRMEGADAAATATTRALGGGCWWW